MALAPAPRLMSAGEAIIRTLAANGVDTVFGLPGAQTYPLFDALDRTRNQIRTIAVRHEQAAAYMAYGYAKSTGRPGVYTVVPGPGVLNTAAALSTAWATNAPVLCITGQIPADALGKRRGHLHEIPDQLATLKSLTKWAVRIERPEDVLEVMGEAFRVMTSGRPGPVTVEMCWDRLNQSAMIDIPSAVAPDAAPVPDPSAIARAAELLARAERPMILVGSGAQHAADAVRALAERLGAPVGAFRGGRGIVAEDHALGVSSYAASQLWKDTDVLIGIGSRLELPYMRWGNPMSAAAEPLAPPHLIRIDIDPDEMTRLVPHVAVVADAEAGTRALSEALAKAEPSSEAQARIDAARAYAARKIEEIKPHAEYLRVIREVLPRDSYFVEELCQAGFASYYAYPVYEPRTYVTPGFQGTLGFGFPTSLGVKAAHPNRAVVSISGDGGFMFGVQDLATAVEYGLGVVTIVYNNGAFGNVRRDLKKLYKGRAIAAEFRNPDFMTLARAFGADGYHVESPAELRPALAQAIEKNVPALIEVMIDPAEEKSPWKYIHTRMG